jgi:radical SAM protein with 4Fe4S-binding SPASM domain
VIVRYEAWGAWVKLETMAALVALDREGVRALGLDGGEAWDEKSARASAPVEVHLAVTSRCAAGCEGCYLDARPDGHEPSQGEMLRVLDALADAGVFTVAFGGGEPTTREDLGVLAEAAKKRGLSPVLTTSGLGLSRTKIERLRSFAQVNVSYDGVGDDYAKVRGFDGARAAEEAIGQLVEAGIAVGVNVVLTRDTFGRLAGTVERARALGAREVQLLRYKPAGRAATLDYMARRLTPEQAESLGPTLRALAHEHAQRPGPFHLRIDCALVAFLSADAELASSPDKLVRFGVFGCEAGGALAAIKVDGMVAPCSFSASTGLAGTRLGSDHGADAELTRWRAYNESPAEPCASCSLRPVCKGGCKVVSTFVDGAHGPDPECPRVRSWRLRARGGTIEA